MNQFFQPSTFGSRGRGAASREFQESPSRLSQDSLRQHQEGLLSSKQWLSRREEEEQQQSQSSNFNSRLLQPKTASTPTASAPTGSSLVAGGPGTGLAASYAPSFGLGGAVSSGALGSYGGATGLMSGTSAGMGAGWSGLGAASSGMTYGGGAAASGAASSGFGLGSASAGMTYGGGAAAGGAASAGGGAAAGGAGSMASGLMSNPWTALAAAIVGGANYLHNKNISSWSDTIKGKAGGNILDYYGGRADGKTHGLLGKIADQDKSVGKSLKSLTDLSELDFKNAFKNGFGSIKDLFKGNII